MSLAKLKKNIRKHWILYVMILPVLVYYIIFSYVPMYGILIAFKDYKVKLGILGSEWIGFKHFQKFFNSYYFGMLLKNTLELSVYGLIVGFPLPIIFALMLNYVNNKHLKKTVQMVSYAPYFISTVVICGMISIFCDPISGVFNILRNMLGLESVDFLAKAEWFKDIYVWSGVWQGLGFSSIIYISALSGVDPQLHEAAIIDGATKVQRMWHVDLPSIKPTVVMLLILNLGGIMSVGFDKAYMLQNSLNQKESEIISTYVYKVGLVDHDYGFSTAVGLFNTVINLALLIIANTVAKKVTEESLF